MISGLLLYVILTVAIVCGIYFSDEANAETFNLFAPFPNRILELHDSTTIPPSPIPSQHLYLSWHDSIFCCTMWCTSLFIQYCRIWIRITVTSREVAGDGGSQRGDSSPSMKINDDGVRMETELEVVCTWLGFNLLSFIYLLQFVMSSEPPKKRRDEVASPFPPYWIIIPHTNHNLMSLLRCCTYSACLFLFGLIRLCSIWRRWSQL